MIHFHKVQHQLVHWIRQPNQYIYLINYQYIYLLLSQVYSVFKNENLTLCCIILWDTLISKYIIHFYSLAHTQSWTSLTYTSIISQVHFDLDSCSFDHWFSFDFTFFCVCVPLIFSLLLSYLSKTANFYICCVM